MVVVMVPDKRQTQMKRPQVKAKGRGWRIGENNSGEYDNP
jgi:hypothetical protein